MTDSEVNKKVLSSISPSATRVSSLERLSQGYYLGCVACTCECPSSQGDASGLTFRARCGPKTGQKYPEFILSWRRRTYCWCTRLDRDKLRKRSHASLVTTVLCKYPRAPRITLNMAMFNLLGCGSSHNSEITSPLNSAVLSECSLSGKP